MTLPDFCRGMVVELDRTITGQTVDSCASRKWCRAGLSQVGGNTFCAHKYQTLWKKLMSLNFGQNQNTDRATYIVNARWLLKIDACRRKPEDIERVRAQATVYKQRILDHKIGLVAILTQLTYNSHFGRPYIKTTLAPSANPFRDHVAFDSSTASFELLSGSFCLWEHHTF